MRVIGIDLSLTATGLSLIAFDGDTLVGIDLHGRAFAEKKFGAFDYAGALIVPTSPDTLGRWEDIVCPIIEWAQHAHRVVIEAYSYGSNMPGHNSIIEIGGIVRYHLRKMGHVPIEVSPTTLKKFITGNGGSKKHPCTKEHVLEAVKRQGIPIEDHNMADGYGLSQIGRAMELNLATLPAHQREVITTLSHPKVKEAPRRRSAFNVARKARAQQLPFA